MPNDFPAIEVEVKIAGKKVSKKFKATLNTSVFAHSIFDLLKKSDNKSAIVRIAIK